jgi:hypothetical protein
MLDLLMNLVLGCRHPRMTRPITLVHKPGTGSATYVVCLDCGKHFPYDLVKMKVVRQTVRPSA